MRRTAWVGFAWLVALLLAFTPVLSSTPSVGAQADDSTPVVDETATDTPPVDPTETPIIIEPTATVEPTEEVVESPVATETATVEETATDLPTQTATDTPTEPATQTPSLTPTPPPTKTVQPTQDDGFSSAAVTDLEITLSCATDPETIRVKNIGAADILLKQITTYLDVTANEPFTVNRNLKPGQTAIYQSGHGAQYGTVLTSNFIFTNSAYDAEGVRISTSVGKAVKMCDARPLPPPPPAGKLSDLKITLLCNTAAESIRVSNNGTGYITLKGIATYIDPIAAEPFSISRVLAPGQTAIYQAGLEAKYGTVLTKEYIFTNAAYEKDGVRVNTNVGKAFKACPAKPVPLERWIEVNLSTQYLIAWYGNTRVNETWVSTGKPGFETPTGTYYINLRYRYDTMQGCIQGECYYVPDVPWVQYFTNYGHALHGAYWHNDFGSTRSHGCVNLPLWFAEWLWNWATYGTRLWIHY